MMNQEEQKFLQMQEEELEVARLNDQQSKVSMAQQMMDTQSQERGLIKEQLDLSEELDTIEHLLRGHVLTHTENGREWKKSNDPDMMILTDHGIYLIMNTIMFYVNKNTLLSNYDQPTINKKMYDFSTDLADTIFMEYEKVFKYPSFKECKEALIQRLDKKTELRMFALELNGIQGDEDEIKEQFIEEIEEKIESEIAKIREQVIKNKLKRFLIIMRQIQDTIHSTYLRAYAGQERKTLRQHIHISENVNPRPIQHKGRKLNPLNWGS